MLNIRNVEEIETFLRSLPELVRQHENRSPAFTENVDDWLDSLQKVLEANRLYQAGAVAMLRDTLISVKQGLIPSGIEVRGRRSRARILKTVAADAMQQGSSLASNVVEENRPRIEESARVAQQIVAAAFSRKLVPQRNAREGSTEYLQRIRHTIASAPDLEGAIVHLEGLVGPQDALICLDRSLTAYLNVASLTNLTFAMPVNTVESATQNDEPDPTADSSPPVSGETEIPKVTPEPEELLHPDDAINVFVAAAMVNPKGTDRGNEWISVINLSSENVNLNGWTVSDTKRTPLDIGALLEPSERVLLPAQQLRFGQ